MTYIVTPDEWNRARDQIAYAVCQVQRCGGTRLSPCADHRAAAEKLLTDCERAYDQQKSKR